jgi:poly(3-hydroxybutyrate) depolymerase
MAMLRLEITTPIIADYGYVLAIVFHGSSQNPKKQQNLTTKIILEVR